MWGPGEKRGARAGAAGREWLGLELGPGVARRMGTGGGGQEASRVGRRVEWDGFGKGETKKKIGRAHV